jgi:hypothetical protein
MTDKQTREESIMIGRYVVVRNINAGVHVGVLASMDGMQVTLTDARRIWSWVGANTLNEIALHGVGAHSRVSESIPEIALTQAIEVIPCSPSGEENLRSAKWAK